MYQSPPNRRQRSKRVKVKYVVQICLFLVIFFWLLYQINHSHDKSKELDETEAKARNSNPKYPNLGRKGVYDKTTFKNGNEIHEPIEEKESVKEEDKLEDYENKSEEDDADGMYQDLIREEEFSDEYENKARRVDFRDALTESDKGLLDVSEHNGDSNSNKSKHGVREENYKADDASSAVTHEAQMGAIGNVSEHTENSKEQSKNKRLEEGTKEVRKDFVVDGGEIAGVGRKSNGTLLTGKSSHDLTISGSTEVNIEIHDMSETKPELDHDPQASGLDSNSTDSTDADFLNLSTNSTVPLSSEEDEIKVEKKDVNDGTFETLESTVAENPEEGIQLDDSSSDKSDMLPEIEAKETNSDVSVAAE